jgi:hypothetical protein
MRQIVIMPGGFHPFHAGHASLYQSAVKAFPNAEVYVAATNDTKTRPFPFAIKEKLAKLAGVADKHFVQVKSPFQAREITDKYNPEEDVLIFVRSEKDKTEQPKPGGTKKDGSPAYFQPYTGKNLQPFSKHAYIAYLPTVEFGPGITSATEIRNAWPKLDDRRKTAMVMSLYPVTQKNPKLAANVVKMLDMGMGEQQGLAEMDSQGYTGSRDKKSNSKYGSRDDYELGKGKEHTGKAITANNMVKAAKKVWDYATEPVDAPNIETYKKHRAKNIANIRKNKDQGVKEGSLNEFAPDGFNGGDDDEGFSPEIAKMAQEDGFTKGAGLADGATLERAMAINHWHSTHGGMYKQYFAKGFKAGRMDKIRHNNKQYNLNLKLMKDGSIRHGEQGVAEGEVVPFKQPSKTLTWEQVPKDVLLVANDWFWASEDNSGLDATIDPEGYGNGTANDVKYLSAKLQQKGWTIDFNDEYDQPGEFNLRLTNKRGQTVLLPIEDAQNFTGWAKGTSSYDLEEGASLSVEQLAHISDKALDDAYHYGRSTPGANFGWLANIQSAKAAKRLIDAGVTDIEAISDAIHKGWNVTAAADYKGQLQLDTPTPEDKKLKRAKLAMQSYSQLPEEEKEKDRVVARALLQAIKGTSLNEGPFVQRITNPKKVSIYLRIGKGSKLVATDIPYEILDKYVAKVIQKYPQFKPTDFSFASTDKVDEAETNQDYLEEN